MILVVALSTWSKTLLVALFGVGFPAVTIAVVLAKLVRRRRPLASREVATGASAATPFVMIGVVGTLIIAASVIVAVILLTAYSVADEGGTEVQPTTHSESTSAQDELIPTQGNATRGKTLFVSSGCGGCHTLVAARTTGKVGPDLDESRPDFADVVESLIKGPGEMPVFTNRLSNAELRDVAKFVSTVTDGQTEE